LLKRVGLQTLIPTAVANRLIARLPKADRERVLANCTSITLAFGDVLCEPNQPYAAAYFPQTASISLVAEADGHPPMETALIGAEGMLGATLLLGIDAAPQRAVVQSEGKALRMSPEVLFREASLGSAFLGVLQNYLHAQIAQLSQTTACTRFHTVEQRLARWLLLAHDRAQNDHFHLTHQHIADALGVQRSAITIAAGGLQAQEFIDYSRGEIQILNRAGLEAASCGCYAVLIRQYTQRFQKSGSGRVSPLRQRGRCESSSVVGTPKRREESCP